MARVKTGVAELDKMLDGGFLEGDAVMVAGSAGTGKTTLALQYLVSGIESGYPGIYLSFEQLPDQLYRDAKNFGWDLRMMENENKLRVVCTSPNLLVGDGGAEALLEQTMSEINPRRIVIDSLSHLSMFVKDADIRKEVYRTLMYFKTKGLSSFLIWESPQIGGQAFAVSDVGISFLVDTLVLLKFVEIDSSIKKALAILKMRGSDHDRHLRQYEITRRGFIVGGSAVASSFTEYEGVMTGSPTRNSSQKFAELFSKAAAGKKT
jgi:circadian clock protein KaiC